MGTLHLPHGKQQLKQKTDADKRRLSQTAREERVTRAIQWLVETYPAYAQCLPLAIGIHKQTAVDKPKAISANSLKLARKLWSRSPRYLERLSDPGAVRFNLDATPAAPVSDDDRRRALTMLGRS